MKSRLILLFTCLCVAPAFAQDTGVEATTQPTLIFRVIEQQEIDLGDHLLKPVEKKSLFVAFFATVYDHGLTEISWNSPAGQGRAVSTIDFNNFSDNGQLETADTAFSWLLFTDNLSTNPKEGAPDAATFSRVQTEQRQLAALPSAATGQSRYLITSAQTSPATDEPALLTALHLYYDTHREGLILANQQRQIQIAQAEKLAENPPPPADTVINFWPEKNSSYLKQRQSDESAAPAGLETTK